MRIPRVSAWALACIATNSRLSEHPFLSGDALTIIEALRAHPPFVMVNPGQRHAELQRVQRRPTQVRGRKTANAVLAAQTIDNDATLASTDAAFRRLPDLRRMNPLA